MGQKRCCRDSKVLSCVQNSISCALRTMRIQPIVITAIGSLRRTGGTANVGLGMQVTDALPSSGRKMLVAVIRTI